MMKYLLLTFFFFAFLGCASQKKGPEAPSGLKISEINPDRSTALMKQNVLHLAQVYDLSPFLFTRKIHITSGRFASRSHPILTLNSRFARSPSKILSVLMHEELHWWAAMNVPKMRAAVKDLQKIWPVVPQESKTKGKVSTYTHLIICWLQHETMAFYVGRSTAERLLREFIKKEKIYTWANFQVLNKGHAIRKVIEKHGLLPPPLT